jgi:hypothetical protein
MRSIRRTPRITLSAPRHPRGELTVDRFLEHYVPYDLLFGNAKLFGLFGNLFFRERRAHETWTDDVGSHTVRRPFLGHDFGQADQTVLGGDIGCLEYGRFFGMDRAPPRPALYISRSAARVVRNAPSRWMARSCFHLANSN